LVHRQAQLLGDHLHRRRRHLHPVAGPVGLRDHQLDFVAGFMQGS
jgi:hypothetical protein